MDTDSNDGTSPETMNGETKPDAAKVAQTAIIKQVGAVLLSLCSILFPLPAAAGLSLSLSWQPQDLVFPRRYIIASYAGNNDLSLTNLS